jgi:RNA polymerase sigma factor (sigma-70 family)
VRAHVEDAWPEREPEATDANQAGALRSWLVRGTHKVAIHPRRRTGRHREARELLAADAGWLPGDRSGWRGLVSALQRHSVLHALAQLRKGDREILTMAYLEGHSNDEIGRMLQVSARTVSRRLASALEHLEEHARNVGIWLAAFALVALGVVARPGQTYWRLAGAMREDRWTLAAAVGTATIVTVASIAAVATSPVNPLHVPSPFSPAARSVHANPIAPFADSFSTTTAGVVTAAIEAVGTQKAKPTHVQGTQTQSTATNGCGGNPTDAPPSTPIGPRGEGPHTSPVTHPGPGGCGPQAGKTVP